MSYTADEILIIEAAKEIAREWFLAGFAYARENPDADFQRAYEKAREGAVALAQKREVKLLEQRPEERPHG